MGKRELEKGKKGRFQKKEVLKGGETGKKQKEKIKRSGTKTLGGGRGS